MPAASLGILNELLDHYRCRHGCGTLQKVEIYACGFQIFDNEIARLIAPQTRDRGACPAQPGKRHQNIAARAAYRRKQTLSAVHDIQCDKAAPHDRSTL